MAASLSSVPGEIVLNIIDNFDDLKDVASLALVCRGTYHAANDELYQRAAKLHYLLCWACEFGKLGTVKRLLAADADATKLWKHNTSGFFGHPRVHSAKHSDYSPSTMLHNFYGHGRRITVQEDSVHRWNYWDARHHNYGGEQGLISPLFLDKPAAFDDDGRQPLGPVCQWFPLHLAAMNGHVEIARLLLSSGAGLNDKAEKICECSRTRLSNRQPIQSDETVYGFWPSSAQMEPLVKRELFMDLHNAITPVHVALCHRQEEMAIMLLKRGADQTVGSEDRRVHIIHTAAAHGCLNVLKFLFGNGNGSSHAAANINIQDFQGLTPLFYAYKMRQKETLLWLLENNADVDLELGAGFTLLHLACLDGSSEMTRLLVDAGADVNRPWGENISPYLGHLRPLEIWCALMHRFDAYLLFRRWNRPDPPDIDGETEVTKSEAETESKAEREFKAEAKTKAEFEQQKLGVMKKLLDAGAGVGPITRPSNWLHNPIPYPQFSAATIAAALHSIPMLQLLLTSGVDFTQQGSAIHEAIYTRFIKWSYHRTRKADPLLTVQWLVAHGAPMERGTPLTADTILFVCSLSKYVPWRDNVLHWFINNQMIDNTKLGIAKSGSPGQRTHPMDMEEDHPLDLTCPFNELLDHSNFSVCERLLRCDHPPDLVDAFYHLLDRSESDRRFLIGCGWSDKIDTTYKKAYGPQFEFIWDADKNGCIKREPKAFLRLVKAVGLDPSDQLLDTALPSEHLLEMALPATGILLGGGYAISGSRLLDKVASVYDLRRRHDSTNSSRDWDLGIRLAVALLAKNWAAAHFILQQQDTETSWAQEEGIEYFSQIMSALTLAPSPDIIGSNSWTSLITRWQLRQTWSNTDVLTTLFFEACTGPMDLAFFLTHPDIDINRVDSRGWTALGTKVEKVRQLRNVLASDPYPEIEGLLQLLRAGADPRIVSRGRQSLMADLREIHQGKANYFLDVGHLHVLRLDEDKESGRLEIDVRLDHGEKTGRVSSKGTVETFVFDGPPGIRQT